MAMAEFTVEGGSMAAPSRGRTRAKEVFVAQQLQFANSLAGNDPKHRARAMKLLRKFFIERSDTDFYFTHDDFMRIWKGLFYCMWMSDKPLIQEELSEQISQLVHCFQQIDTTLLFIQSFFDTLMVEWYGIDYHRLDKFQMFVRRFLRQSLVICKNKNWHSSSVRGLSEVFGSTVLSPSKCIDECSDLSLTMHFTDIFIEELSKVSEGKLPNNALIEFLKPFVVNFSEQDDLRLQNVIRDRIFYNLIRQSPAGMEYEEKFEAWKRAGFPGTSWQEMVFVGKDDKRSGVKIKYLDPRAGKVNVYLPHISFNAKSVANLLRNFSKKTSNMHRKKNLKHIAHKFQILADGKYPLAKNISKLLRDSKKFRFSKQIINDAVDDLVSFNKNLEKEAKSFENKGKRKRNASSDRLKKSKKMKLEKKGRKESENKTENLGGMAQNKERQVGDENSSPTNGVTDGENNCEGRRALSKNKTQINNVQLKNSKKKKKLQNNLSWSVSEISKFHKDESNVDETSKENKEVENDILSENVTVEADLMTESIVLSGESCQQEEVQTQITESAEIIQEENENVKLKVEMENASLVLEKPIFIQENENTECSEKLVNPFFIPEFGSQPSSEYRENNVLVVHDRKENIVSEDSETLPKKEEITTPLRRSARRRSSVVPKTSGVKEERTEDSGFFVEKNMPKGVKKTPEQNSKPKRKLREIFSPIQVEWEEQDEEEIVLPKQAKMSWEKRLFNLLAEMKTAKRSTTPDREILQEPETGKQEDSVDMTTSNTPGNNRSVNDNGVLNDEKLTPRRINLRSLIRQKRASLQSTPSSSKKVNIALQMNRSQDFTEYIEAVIKSPTVPHDANKKPCKGVLKRSSIKSPINPFYRPPKGLKKM